MAGKSNDNWMQQLWRPAMGWMYMLICLLDMAVFPVLWNLLQAFMHQNITQWSPLTLQGAGLFHLAMGAVLGIAAFGRTQEKLAGTAANPTATTTTSIGGQANGGFSSSPTFSAPQAGGFGASASGFGSGAASAGFGAGSFGGVPSPAPAQSGFGNFNAAPQMTASGKKIVPVDPDPEI